MLFPVRLLLKILGLQMGIGKVFIFQMLNKLNIIRTIGNYLGTQEMNRLRNGSFLVEKPLTPNPLIPDP